MKAYATRRPVLFAALGVLLMAALLLGAGALRARALLMDTLGSDVAQDEQEEYVSSFTLRAEMVSSQMDTRIRGWLSIAPGEEVAVQSPHGRLAGWVYPPVQGGEDTPWALVLHGGLGTDHMQVQDVACMLSLAGYRVLTPDLYGHGGSDGDLCALGVAEVQDVRAWVDWILAEDMGARIVLLGFDEGAMAALLAACDGLPEAVKAVAADSVYRSAEERARELLSSLHSRAGETDMLLLSAAYRAAFGVELESGDLAGRIAQVNLPLLFVHGTGDEDVPAWHSEDLAETIGAELLYIEGASHGMARFVDHEAYEDALLSFFEEALTR